MWRVIPSKLDQFISITLVLGFIRLVLFDLLGNIVNRYTKLPHDNIHNWYYGNNKICMYIYIFFGTVQLQYIPIIKILLVLYHMLLILYCTAFLVQFFTRTRTS